MNSCGLWNTVQDVKQGRCVSDEAFDQLIIGEYNHENNTLLSLLEEKFQEDICKVIPVLGTGVSATFGVPLWKELLETMFPACLEEERLPPQVYQTLMSGADDFNSALKLIKNNCMTPPFCHDLLEYAEYFWKDAVSIIHQGYPSVSEQHALKKAEWLFMRKVKAAFTLSHGGPFTRCDIIANGNGALAKIGDLMCERQINAITYNFDNLLESYLAIQHYAEFKCISDADNMYDFWESSSENLHIYHVHGCIPLEGLEEYGGKSEHIVFSESSYHAAEKITYDWVNTIQAERIHRKDMMMTGFGAQDPNFKRILRHLPRRQGLPSDELKVESHVHFIFFPIEDILKEIDFRGSDTAEERKDDAVLLSTVASIYYKREYLRAYGIYPIWTSYSKLPGMLSSLS